MTTRTTKAIAVAIWAIGLLPATLLMQWLGMVEWSWLGFFTAYAVLAVISFTYELFQRWIERRLAARRAARTGATPTPER